jgi:hypothetical protein
MIGRIHLHQEVHRGIETRPPLMSARAMPTRKAPDLTAHHDSRSRRWRFDTPSLQEIRMGADVSSSRLATCPDVGYFVMPRPLRRGSTRRRASRRAHGAVEPTGGVSPGAHCSMRPPRPRSVIAAWSPRALPQLEAQVSRVRARQVRPHAAVGAPSQGSAPGAHRVTRARMGNRMGISGTSRIAGELQESLRHDGAPSVSSFVAG